jgi:hypothetical protein
MDPVEHLKSLWINGARRWQNRSVKTYARELLHSARKVFMQGVQMRRTPGEQSIRQHKEYAEWNDKMLRADLIYYQKCRHLMAIIEHTEKRIKKHKKS